MAGMSELWVLGGTVRGLSGESKVVQASDAGRWRQAVGFECDGGALPFLGAGTNSDWTGLTSFGDDQARAKVRARHVRLGFVWPSADLRLIFISLFLVVVNRLLARTYENGCTD